MLSVAAYAHAQPVCTQDNCPIVQVDDDPTPVLDPTTYERYRLPEGRRCVVAGDTFQCFTLAEYVELLEMDVDLRFYAPAYEVSQSLAVSLGSVAVQLNLEIDAATEQIATLSEERSRLLNQWTEENRLRLEAENRPVLGSFVGWGLAAAGAVVIAVLSIVMAAVGGS
jgi:hypothetical protein